MENHNGTTTEKLPDFIMLRLMKEERSQLLSCIEEMEQQIKQLQSIPEQEMKELKKYKHIAELMQRIKEQDAEIKRLKTYRDNLLYKAAKPSNGIKSIEPHHI